jgi:Sec-independent protein translocase protein TatA
MSDLRKIRGAGVQLTLPYVLRYSALWLVVAVAAVVLFGITSYLVAAERLSGEALRQMALLLTLQTVFLILAVIALAVFTTHRLAGPYIALKRALEEVKRGELDHPLRLRTADIHLKEIEVSFNEMTAALRERLHGHPGTPS